MQIALRPERSGVAALTAIHEIGLRPAERCVFPFSRSSMMMSRDRISAIRTKQKMRYPWTLNPAQTKSRDIARADLEHSITHLWDATQDMTNIDDARFILPHGAKLETIDLTFVRDLPTGRVDGSDPRCQYPNPGVFDERQCGPWTFEELSTQRGSRIFDE
jgi:hypothetical protein